MGNRYAVTDPTCCRIEHICRMWSARDKTPPRQDRSGAVINFEAAERSAARKLVRSGDETKTRGGHGAGLAGHGVGKALALERGRQVHFTASEKAGKKLHVHLHSVAQTGRLRLMEWGSSFAGADIGLREGKLNRKSEALDMKSDTECDIFGHSAQDL
ncbi:hypothetical protein [Mesorhizobium sp.]|uniref:hypothetical protein n=1 Tax=Mesorhizobium sp. TaxID=1871066 RepID=UPI0025E87619|nr:hypothetical protein [Mesorhizobium sp.]